MREIFKLVILHDARRNAYSVWDHNLSPRMAEELIQDLRSKLLSARVVNQRVKHRGNEPEACRLCRKDVRRARGLSSPLRFQRRNPQ
jgi:hypothetical protein